MEVHPSDLRDLVLEGARQRERAEAAEARLSRIRDALVAYLSHQQSESARKALESILLMVVR